MLSATAQVATIFQLLLLRIILCLPLIRREFRSLPLLRRMEFICPDLIQCTFVTPTDQESFDSLCNDKYLSSPFICDPQNQMSHAEAQQITNEIILPANLSSCFRKERDKARTMVMIGIVYRPQLIALRPNYRETHRHTSKLQDLVSLTRGNYHCSYFGAPNFATAARNYADRVRDEWNHANDCKTSVLILVLYRPQLIFDNGEGRNETDKIVVVSYDNVTLKPIDAYAAFDPEPKVQRADRTRNTIANIVNQLKLQTEPSEELTPFREVRVKKNCPAWAIGVLFGCGLGGLILAWIGHAVSQSNSRTRQLNKLGVVSGNQGWKVKFSYNQSGHQAATPSSSRRGLFVR